MYIEELRVQISCAVLINVDEYYSVIKFQQLERCTQ